MYNYLIILILKYSILAFISLHLYKRIIFILLILIANLLNQIYNLLQCSFLKFYWLIIILFILLTRSQLACVTWNSFLVKSSNGYNQIMQRFILFWRLLLDQIIILSIIEANDTMLLLIPISHIIKDRRNLYLLLIYHYIKVVLMIIVCLYDHGIWTQPHRRTLISYNFFQIFVSSHLFVLWAY